MSEEEKKPPGRIQWRAWAKQHIKIISPPIAIILIVLIMTSTYFSDRGLFNTLLGWLLGGIIVQLVGIALFGSLISNVMKNKDVQFIIKTFKDEFPDLKQLLKELVHYLAEILQNQKNHPSDH